MANAPPRTRRIYVVKGLMPWIKKTTGMIHILVPFFFFLPAVFAMADSKQTDTNIALSTAAVERRCLRYV